MFVLSKSVFVFHWALFAIPGHEIISSSPGQNGRRFTDDIFKPIFLNENFQILIGISLKFVPKGPINNNPALV